MTRRNGIARLRTTLQPLLMSRSTPITSSWRRKFTPTQQDTKRISSGNGVTSVRSLRVSLYAAILTTASLRQTGPPKLRRPIREAMRMNTPSSVVSFSRFFRALDLVLTLSRRPPSRYATHRVARSQDQAPVRRTRQVEGPWRRRLFKPPPRAPQVAQPATREAAREACSREGGARSPLTSSVRHPQEARDVARPRRSPSPQARA